MKALSSVPDESKVPAKEKGPDPHSSVFSPSAPVQAGLVQRKPDCACGGGCPLCQNTLPFQAKLAVSQPGDLAEDEADHVADRIVGMPEPAVARTEKETNSASADRSSVSNSFVSDLGAGEPLDRATRAFMEPRFGHDFSGVRVHKSQKASESAADVNARAYTVGRDVVVADGEPSFDTTAGRRLLAHELTHVLQQDRDGRMSGAGQHAVRVHDGPVKIARTPRSLTQSLLVRSLRDNELEDEIMELRAWLTANTGHADHARLSTVLTELETEAMNRPTIFTRGAVAHTGTVGSGTSAGTVEVRTNEEIAMAGGRLGNVLAISYAGANAPTARWLQFVWFEMEVVSPAGTARVAGSIPTTSGTKPFTTNPASPSWSLDVDPADPSPYYIEAGGVGIRDATTQAMFDAPGGTSVGPLFQAALSSVAGATSATFRAHFSTYLLINDVVQYLVPWTASTTATVSGATATIANIVYAIGSGAGAASSVPTNLRTILHTAFPTYSHVR